MVYTYLSWRNGQWFFLWHDMNQKILTKRVISKMSVDSNFTSYAWLCALPFVLVDDNLCENYLYFTLKWFLLIPLGKCASWKKATYRCREYLNVSNAVRNTRAIWNTVFVCVCVCVLFCFCFVLFFIMHDLKIETLWKNKTWQENPYNTW